MDFRVNRIWIIKCLYNIRNPRNPGVTHSVIEEVCPGLLTMQYLHINILMFWFILWFMDTSPNNRFDNHSRRSF